MRKEQALLTHEQFERELNYDAALSVARRMLAAGLEGEVRGCLRAA